MQARLLLKQEVSDKTCSKILRDYVWTVKIFNSSTQLTWNIYQNLKLWGRDVKSQACGPRNGVETKNKPTVQLRLEFKTFHPLHWFLLTKIHFMVTKYDFNLILKSQT